MSHLQTPEPDEIIKDADDRGRVLFPAQSGQDFYKRLFRALNLGSDSGMWDFVIVEMDGGVCDLMELAGNVHMLAMERVAEAAARISPRLVAFLSSSTGCRPNVQREKACQARVQRRMQMLHKT